MDLKTSIYIISGKNPLLTKSGYASYAYNLAKLLTSSNLRVEIFCFGEKNQVLKTRVGTVNILSSKLFNVLKDVEMAGLIILAPQLANLVRHKLSSNAPPVIWGIGPWSLAGAFIKLLKGKRVFFLADYFTTIKHEFWGTLQGITVKDHGLLLKLQSILAYLTIIPLYSILEHFLLYLSDKIITHYKSTENILTNQFGIPSKKYVRLPYYVEPTSQGDALPLQQQPPDPHTFPLLLLISRHDGRKGINFLLRACSILNTRGIEYSAVIIGTGNLRKAHLNLAQRLKLKNVYMPGFVKNLKPYFRKADLFVFPTLEEGSSALAILEAMKFGLPIVSTDVDGIPEDLIHGKSALLVPPKDPQALADAIEKLLKNPPLAPKLGLAAKKEYQKKYNRHKVIKEISRFLIE